MALFAIADLHLSTAVEKPMDVFGSRWTGYTEKLEKNWRAVVSDDDTVVIPGDVSWAMRLDEAAPDLRFIDSLPGRKIIGKGNHDLWWSTVSKMEDLLGNEGITTVRFLHNNAYLADGRIIAGTRGWFPDQKSQSTKTAGDADFEKISKREAARLRQSLDAGVALREAEGLPDAEILVFFHFPPAFSDFESRELLDTMREYGVKRCFYGHIHNVYDVPRTDERDSLRLSIISADYLNFIPYLIG